MFTNDLTTNSIPKTTSNEANVTETLSTEGNEMDTTTVVIAPVLINSSDEVVGTSVVSEPTKQVEPNTCPFLP